MPEEVVKCLGQYVRSCQEFPSGLPGTPGGSPAAWGKQIGDSCGLDAAGVLAVTIQEMQLQSYSGVIRVFPAWPKGWQSEFALMAEGGFLVTSRIGKGGEIPEIRIQGNLGGTCAVINPWPGEATLSGLEGDRGIAAHQRISFETKPGDVAVLIPVSTISVPSSIPVARNEGPKWPFHQGTDHSIAAYMKRTDSFGMIGIAKDGQNQTRNKVRKALAEQAQSKNKE
jgi:hypothetical protein